MEEKGIKTAEQAYKQAMKVNKAQSEPRNHAPKYKQRQLASREMTPKWLLEAKDQDDHPATANNEPEEDEKLKADREAFLKHLKQQWKEE